MSGTAKSMLDLEHQRPLVQQSFVNVALSTGNGQVWHAYVEIDEDRDRGRGLIQRETPSIIQPSGCRSV